MSAAKLIALFGPTGIGKTEIALELGERMRAAGRRPVAVSADALQVYRGLEILTGVATAEEQARLEHRLVSFLPPEEQFSAGQYAELAHAEIDDLIAAGATPIVVGGTGLYLRAALTDLHLRPPPPEGLRERLMAELESTGPAALHARLRTAAPAAAARIQPGDRQRVVRALELLELGELAELEGDDDSQLWTAEFRQPTLLVGLTMERQALYRRIDGRVEAMVRAGAVQEVRQASRAGASATAQKALGFQELLAGDVEAMKRRTRNYARRQLTWMRKLGGVEVIDVGARRPAEVAREIHARFLQGSGVRG